MEKLSFYLRYDYHYDYDYNENLLDSFYDPEKNFFCKKVELSDEDKVIDIFKHLDNLEPLTEKFDEEFNAFLLARGDLYREEIINDPGIIHYYSHSYYYLSSIDDYYHQNIKDLNILNKETLVLKKVLVRINDPYLDLSPECCAVSVATFEQFEQSVNKVNEVNKNLITDSLLPAISRLQLVFLYTDAEKKLAIFVRQNYEDLHQLSGNNFLVYAIEKLSTATSFQDLIKYWNNNLLRKYYIFWSSLGMLKTKPYDRTQSYKIADKLGVDKDKIPCLVLFDEPRPNRVLVFPIKNATIEHFRKLFSTLDKIVNSLKNKHSGTIQTSIIFEAIAKEYEKFKNILIGEAPNKSPDNPSIINNINAHNINGEFKVGSNHNVNIIGDVNNNHGVINLGKIIGNVTNTINQLPDSSKPNESGIKENLTKLKEAIVDDTNLSEKDKEKALKQIQKIAEAVQEPNNEDNKDKAEGALEILKKVVTGLPGIAAAAKACQELIPMISTLFGL